MSTHRRLTAAVCAVALGWVGLAVLDVSAAQADPGHRAPHDPATYYAGTEGLSGAALATALNSIIDGNTFIPYTSTATDVWDAVKVLDRDPNNANRIIDAYSGDSLDAANQCGSSCALDGWNREHTWAQSRGSFNTSPGPGTDLFHMRPLRGNTNSSRGNLDFDETVNSGDPVPGCPVVCQRDSDSFEPREAIKGDIARGLFYMDVRYNGDPDDQFAVDLRMWDQTGNSGSQIGKLSSLVAWSLADPPDDAERLRNDLIDSDYQHNRNPFIDHPEWVCSIWGSQVPASTCAINNHPPTTAPMTKTTLEDAATTVALTASDVDGDTLTWSITGAAAHGAASITGGSTLNYTPAANYHGTDVVGVTVSDGKGGTSATTATITVSPVNDAPSANAQGVSTLQDTAKVITLTGVDVDGDPLTYAIGTGPAHGTVTLAGNQATYTPTSGYDGLDPFTFTVDDGTVTSPEGTVSINVTVVNHPPAATAQSVTTAEDSAKVITVAGTDDDGDSLSYAIGAQPGHGTVNLVGDEATYTPTANYHGPDFFTFTVSDGTVTSPAATVSITVTSVNDVPVATVQSLSTAEDTAEVITLAGTDGDGDGVSYAIGAQPTHGTVNLVGDEATYISAPNYHGPDSFTFTASDGTVTSPEATVSITVTSVNDAPAATAQNVTTAEDNEKVVTVAGTDVDSDDDLTFAIGVHPGHGTLSLADDQATYTPAANYHGPDSFTFTLSDGTVSSAATVSVTVTPVDDAPVATPAAVTTSEDTPKSFALVGGDVDGQALTYAIATQPGHGTVTLDGAQATYTPHANHVGPDAFTFTASDATATSAPATVSVTVTPVNDAPTVTGTLLQTTAGTPVSKALVTSDPDGDTVTVTAASDPAHGSVTFSATTVTYTPAIRSGTDTFLVTVSDGNGGTAQAQVGVEITALTTQLQVTTPSATRGTAAVTTITATGPAGATPAGSLTLTDGATTLGTATLRPDGTASVPWTPALAGVTHLVASYAGDARFAPTSSPPVPVTVAKTTAKLEVSGSLRSSRPGVVKVKVSTVAGLPATGKVTLKVGSTTFIVKLKKGVAKVRVPEVPATAKVRVKASYSGDGQYAGGSVKRTFHVRR